MEYQLSPQLIKVFKECFSSVSVKELLRRIDFYKTMTNVRTISEDSLRKELQKLFAVDINGKQVSFFLKADTHSQEYEYFHFYRVRKFTQADYTSLKSKNFDSIQREQDIWARPASDVNTTGRLNRVNESMLYAAAQSTNAIFETGCKVNDCFFLLVYRSKKRLRVSQIHVGNYFEDFDELENAKHAILHNFLLGEFTKVVPYGQEYLYKSSIAIYKQFFHSDYIDAFTYPSVRSEIDIGFNICFSAEKAKESLDFCGVMVCRLAQPVPGSQFNMAHYYDGFLNEKGTFDFYPANSSIAREKFGNFSRIRDMGL